MKRSTLSCSLALAILAFSSGALAGGGMAGGNGMAATHSPPGAMNNAQAAQSRQTIQPTQSTSASSVSRDLTTASTRTVSANAGAQHATGQPSVECGEPGAENTPGNSAAAPGSAFNEDGKAGQVYAGQQPQNSKNPTSVSQYDAACAHQPPQ